MENTNNEAINWDLSQVLKEDQFDERYQEILNQVQEFNKYQSKLNPDMAEAKFQEILKANDHINKHFSILVSYISLRLATNIKDMEMRALRAKQDSLSIKIHDATLFFSHWIKGLIEPKLDDSNAKRLFQCAGDFQFTLEFSRAAAKHTLSEREEQIMHRKEKTGVDVISQLYTMFTNDFTYSFEVEGQEKIEISNQQELLKYVHSYNAAERKAAYQALFTPYLQHADKLFLIYSAIARDWAEEAKLRNYEDSIAMRHRANKMSKDAVDTLLHVCKKNLSLFQKYFKIKAKLLGQEKLSRYDLYAPLDLQTKKHDFKDAQELVFTSFEKFWPDFATKAKSIIEKQHLDSHPKENKRGGAFCMSITSEIAPYVLTNFDGTTQAVSTLAHELGHAVHDLHTTKLSHTVAHAPLPICETASTFAETLVFEALLEKASDEEKKALLLDKVAESYATIIRQNYFVLFEIKAHQMLLEGASAKELNETYFALLQEQFGDSVELSEEFAYEWSYIPHIFHSPFYCYAYNFGELLSLSLYAMYKKEGKETFIPKLEKLLSAGGSLDPKELLQSMGIDITDENFWQGGFKIIEEWVEMLEKE